MGLWYDEKRLNSCYRTLGSPCCLRAPRFPLQGALFTLRGLLLAWPSIWARALHVREQQRGWKTQERGRHTIRPLPNHPRYASPPPLVHGLSYALEEMGTDQSNPIFMIFGGRQSAFGGCTLLYVGPPRMIRCAPLFCR